MNSKKILKSSFAIFLEKISRSQTIVKILLKIFRWMYSLPFISDKLCDQIVYLFQTIYKNQNPDASIIKKVKVKKGFYMYVDIIDRLGGLIYFYKNYSEKETQNFHLQNLKTGDILIDVGANHGYFSLLAASIVGPSGYVYSFEPNKYLCELLRKSVQCNGYKNVIIENYAVSEKSGIQIPLYLPSDKVNSAVSTIVLKPEKEDNGLIKYDTYQLVDSISLDDYFYSILKSKKLMLKVLNMVVKGMKKLLIEKMAKYIIIESNELNSKACQIIKDSGYKINMKDIFVKSDDFGNYIFERV